MNRRTSVRQLWILIFALSFSLVLSGFRPSPVPQEIDEYPVQLDQFDMVADSSGWGLLGRQLFWTFDGGQSWDEIGPSVPEDAAVQDVAFIDANAGWVLWSVTNSDGSSNFQLAHTSDHGETWIAQSLPLFESGEIVSYAQKAEMGWFDEQKGWISAKQDSGSNFSIGTLFTTSDGGNNWRRFTLPVADDIYFNDPQMGWAIGKSASNQLFRTRDGGLTWEAVRLPDSSNDTQSIYPAYISGGDNLLVMTGPGVGNSLKAYSFEDSSNQWLPIDQIKLDSEPGVIGLSILNGQGFVAVIPGTKSIVRLMEGKLGLLENADGRSASIVALDMVSLDVGWAKSVESSCTTKTSSGQEAASVSCSSTARLLYTTNGGITWQTVNIPRVPTDQAAVDPSRLKFTQTLSAVSNSANTMTFVGQGFDRCQIPTLPQMQTWSEQSPYGAVNLYIGGSNRTCNNTALISSYLFQLYQQGWSFFPTWVGPQAPCTGYLSRISSDIATAYQQGITQADLAVERLAELGLTGPTKTGSIIYYDIENYGTNSACRSAVNAFMNGWVSQIHVRGNLAGAYGSTLCNTGLSDFLSIPNIPDVIWPARWYHNLGSGYYDPSASVWNLGSCIPNTAWSNHQRIRQYEGDHNETWGNLTLDIDSDVLDGVVAVPYDYPFVSSILPADSNPTNAASVNFTVSFSKIVTGVNAADFALTTTGGMSGVSITNVTGSGTTYTVTINTGSGSGRIHLDVVDNDSIQDGVGNALGGAGTGNGDFNSGEDFIIVHGFFVSGRNLLDANGKDFIMRGINHPHNWYPGETGAFADIKAKGANTVRVVLSLGYSWPKNDANDVASVINLCKINKLVCVLEVHDTTGYGEVDAVSLAQAVDYWKEIKSVLDGQEAHVIINLGNEPYGNVNATNWINDTKGAILEMRNAGFQHMLMVDAPDWGQDWEFVMRNNAAAVFASDPNRNVVFSIHMYGVYETASAVQDYISAFVNAGLPLVIDEFGPLHTDGDPDEDAIMSIAQANGIGYLGWSWSGNSPGGEYLDMVVDFDPNQETGWGNRIIHGKDGIIETSCEATVYGIGNRTIVGNTGVAGVTLSYFNGTPKTVTADNNGNYTMMVPCGWSGTVTPSRTGFTFVPTSQAYTNLGANQSNQNYLASWVGAVKVESDRNVVAVGRPHVDSEVASYGGFSSGSLSSYVPMLFKGAFGGTYDSALYVQNVHASNTASITIKYYDSNGVLDCTKADTIAPLSSKGYWVPTATCDSGSLPAGWVGGAVVTSNQPIVMVGRPHVGGQVMTYDGFASGSLSAYVPMLFKGAFGGSYNAAFYVQNTHDTNTASITIKYYDDSGLLNCTKTDTIAPLASKGYWVPTATCDTGSLPDGWVGGVAVTSDQPIVAVGRPHIGTQVTTYTGFATGSLTSYVPMLFKGAFGSYDSAFYVQNVHETITANVIIKYYDSVGNLNCTKTDTIAPLASKGYWLPSATCDSGSLPSSWVGGVVVTSDQPIVAVGRPHLGPQVTTYNGFTTGNLNAYVPMLFRDGFGGSYDSALYLQNLDAANIAHITIKLYDANGNLACTLTDTLSALSSKGYWLPSLLCPP